MSTRDKLERAGTSVAAALGLFDRARAWWSKRREEKAEARRVHNAELAIETDIALQRISDEAARQRGTPPCPAPGCERPNFHSGVHGRTP